MHASLSSPISFYPYPLIVLARKLLLMEGLGFLGRAGAAIVPCALLTAAAACLVGRHNYGVTSLIFPVSLPTLLLRTSRAISLATASSEEGPPAREVTLFMALLTKALALLLLLLLLLLLDVGRGRCFISFCRSLWCSVVDGWRVSVC